MPKKEKFESLETIKETYFIESKNDATDILKQDNNLKYLILPKDLENHVHFFDRNELINFLEKKRSGSKWLIYTLDDIKNKKIFIDIKD